MVAPAAGAWIEIHILITNYLRTRVARQERGLKSR